MKATTNRPRLTLEFIGHSTPRLERTKFIRAHEPSESAEPELHECKRGDTFTWTDGPKALCLYVLRYKSSALRGRTLETLLHGDESSPVKSLVGAVVKESGWGQDMFGFDGSGNTLLLPQFFKVMKVEYPKRIRNSSRQKGQPKALGSTTTFEVEIQAAKFPPESMIIHLNGERVSTPKAMEKLADAVEDQWYASNREYTKAWNKIRAKRTGHHKAQRRVTKKSPRKSKIKQRRKSPSSGSGAIARTAPKTGEVSPTSSPSALQRLVAAPANPPEAVPSGPPVPLLQTPSPAGIASLDSPQTDDLVTGPSTARLSERDVLPFSIITHATASFLKLREGPFAAINPQYRTIRYEEMPYLSPYQTVKHALELDRCAMIRGTRRSGRTTLAQQLAIDFVRNAGSAYYLDLAATPPSSPFLQSTVETLAFLCSNLCLLLIDNIDANRMAGTQIYNTWSKYSGKSLLILVSTWPPASAEPIDTPLTIPDERLIDLRFNLDDYISVYKFWGATFANGSGKVRPDLIKPHLCGASVGRFCDGLEAHRKAQTRKQEALSVYESGELAIDLTRGLKTVRQIPLIRDFLLSHPEEDSCLTSMKRLLDYLEEGRLSEHSKVTEAFSDLSKHRAHKWYYILDTFSFVIGVLVCARSMYPPIYNSYYEAIEQERTFSTKMATRVLEHKHTGASRYILFAEAFLPTQHTVHLVECLFNAGPEFMFDVTGPWTLDIVVNLLKFLNKHLPSAFARSFVARWSEPKPREKLQLMVAGLAASNGELFATLTQDPMMRLLMEPQMLQDIAARPKAFIDRLLPARVEPARRVLCDSRIVAVPLSHDTAEAQSELATNAFFPFSIISPLLPLFRQPGQRATLVAKPSYREMYDCSVPRASAFHSALSATETNERSVIIRGPRASGKTTLALQVALRQAHEAWTPLYLDLAKPDEPELLKNAISNLAHLAAGAYTFVVDNAHSNPIGAETIYDIWKHMSGQPRMVLTTLWAPAKSQAVTSSVSNVPRRIVDLHYTVRDFEMIYYFWINRLLARHKDPQPFKEDTYLFLAASLRRLMEALTRRSENVAESGRLRAYDGQGKTMVFQAKFPHHYKGGLALLGDHLRRKPEDEVFSRWTIGELIKQMAEGLWAYREFFIEAFSNVLQYPVLKWRLLLDSFREVIQFLVLSRNAYPPIFQGYRACIRHDREFSEQMGLRVFYPEDFRSLQYATWADACLPREHVAGIAEGFYNMGPDWVASNVAKATKCAQLGALFKFVKEWLPTQFGTYVTDKWCEGPNAHRLKVNGTKLTCNLGA